MPFRARRPLSFLQKNIAPALLVVAMSGAPLAHAVDGDAAAEPAPLLARISSFTDRAAGLAIEAMSLVGIHYRLGGTSPENGLDCSGLVRYVFRQANGTELPRTSSEISQVGERVDKKDLQPGDLVFFNTMRRAFSHVGIYVGDGKFIHAPRSGAEVRVEDMQQSYWKRRFDGARRVSTPLAAAPAQTAQQ